MAEHREQPAPSVDGWQPGETAPRDHGREIRIQLDCSRGVPAYWDDELQTFVLSRPLHMESIARPIRWRPAAPQTEPVELGEGSNTDPQPETASATPPSPPAVPDYTERADAVANELVKAGLIPDQSGLFIPIRAKIAAALSAVASDRHAEGREAERAALLARLREPEMREAVKAAIAELRALEVEGCFNPSDDTEGECADGACYCTKQIECEADAALAAITEKLT